MRLIPLPMTVGETAPLYAVMTFKTAPETQVIFRNGMEFFIETPSGTPILAVQPNSSLRALRPGVGRVYARFGTAESSHEAVSVTSGPENLDSTVPLDGLVCASKRTTGGNRSHDTVTIYDGCR